MFCPEDGAEIPLTEEIAGAHPIYECPRCEHTWVYDSDSGTYKSYKERRDALWDYSCTEEDITQV